MIKYYFETQHETSMHRLIAIIEDQYYWSMEWSGENPTSNAVIKDFQAGFASEEIKEKCKMFSAVSPVDIRNQFGSFAYYIERAVNGFKSYILWISPDPAVSHISWQIPLN